MSWIVRAFAITLVVVGLTGCAAPAARQDTQVAADPRSPSPPPDPARRGGAPAGDADALVARAVADAAARTGVEAGSIRVARAEAREWSDAGLGCPKPGMGYAQVITPGYLIVLEAAGQTLEYHADRSRVDLCER
jgi:hypothetical protein